MSATSDREVEALDRVVATDTSCYFLVEEQCPEKQDWFKQQQQKDKLLSFGGLLKTSNRAIETSIVFKVFNDNN